MSDSKAPKDIIQTALDLMGEQVTLSVSYPARPRITHVDGRLTGITHIDDEPHLAIETDIRATVVSLAHITDITPRQEHQ